MTKKFTLVGALVLLAALLGVACEQDNNSEHFAKEAAPRL